jgi:hypothetical protein
LALPLLKRGVPVNILHLENVSYAESWKNTKVLLMSYANMKPLDGKVHQYIADWVKRGGVLIYSAADNDPFQTVLEWWNQNGNHFNAPSEHLFQLMGLSRQAKEGRYVYGKGVVYVIRQDPKDFVLYKNSDMKLISLVKQAYEKDSRCGTLCFKNSFYLERGPYDIISVLDEGVDTKPFTVNGMLIDLYDPSLPILTSKQINVGEQSLLYDINRVSNSKHPQVLAAASRVYDEKNTSNSYSFVVKSPLNTTNIMRVLLPRMPKAVIVSDAKGQKMNNVKYEWDKRSRTCLLGFENYPEGVSVIFNW